MRYSLVLVVFLANFLAAAEKSSVVADTPVERLKKDLAYLASDELGGRGTGSKEIDVAADYVAAQFKEAAKEAEGKCPISNALRGSLDIQLEVDVR